MYVYYKIGTRSFRLRPPTFLRCKGTSKIRIDEKKRDIFSLTELSKLESQHPAPYFLGTKVSQV